MHVDEITADLRFSNSCSSPSADFHLAIAALMASDNKTSCAKSS